MLPHRVPVPCANSSDLSRTPPLARPPRRLDDFILGPGNRLAHAAARELIRTTGAVFNPLVIHGGVGLGKTHLLEATAHGLRANASRAECSLDHGRGFHEQLS